MKTAAEKDRRPALDPMNPHRTRSGYLVRQSSGWITG
jgi:hypothetical protein